MTTGTESTDRVFLALANPVRRELLRILAEGPLAAGELSERFTLSRPAVAEHLKVLRDAGLVADSPDGRRRIYRLTAEPLADLGDWLHPFEKFWRARLSALADVAEELGMAVITLDQFVAAAPAAVWRALTEPELVRRWWAEGDIGAEVGHEFTLDMPGFGAQPCRVLESVAPERFVYTFTTEWTLAWTLRAEGRGTRVLLEHSGFDLDDKRMAAAFERMGPGWRDVVLPRLAETAAALGPAPVCDDRLVTDRSVLADPVNAALSGPHARFRLSAGRIQRYHPDVSVFYGHPRALTDEDYADVAHLTGADRTALLRDRAAPLPSGWTVVETIGLVQYDGSGVETAPEPEAVRLTAADVPEMTALVERTKPGPFLPRTIELGTYLGIRDADGALIAMAGERMHPQGWTEISAVCTAPEARGRGLASRLIRAVGHGIRERGDVPFLHTSDDNPAQKLYDAMGFHHTSTVPLEVVRVPSD